MLEPERKEGDSGEAWSWSRHGPERPKDKVCSPTVDDQLG
jgi:hypothetical protein